MLVKEIPLIRICLPLCLGIISGLYLHPGLNGCIFLIICSAAGLFISLLFNRRITNIPFGAAFFFTVFTIGLIMYSSEKAELSELTSEITTFSAELMDYPDEKMNSVMLNIKLGEIISSGGNEKVKGSMVLYHRDKSFSDSLLPGDRIIFRCNPVPVENRGNPCEFDYKFYMASRGIKYYGFTGKSDIIAVKPPGYRKLRYEALIIRNKIISMYETRGVAGKRLALVSAITLGEKSQLDQEQKQNFIKAGVMHIMAVSGLHAGILSLFIFNLLFFLKGRLNFLRVVITILFLWVFAFITGLTPSVLRATFMFSFLQAGNLMKRRVNGINSILASAIILMMIRPSVIFEAGFLLSYSAVWFIIGFYRDLYNIFTFRNRLADLVWQSVAVTLVAQAGTLSLAIMLFNRFPLWFIITNVIIVPLSSLLIIAGCMVPVTYPVRFLSSVFAWILDKLAWLTEQLAAKAANLPLSSIDNIGLTIPECVLLTAAISISMYWLFKKPRISMLYPLIAFFLFASYSTIKIIVTANKDELIVYNTATDRAIGIKTGRILNVYSGTSKVPPEVFRHSSTLGLKIRSNLLSDKPVYLKTGSRIILITDTINFALPGNDKIDFLILTGSKPVADRSYHFNNPGNIFVITTEAWPGYRPWFISDRDSASLIWAVRKSGSFIHAL